MSKKQKRNPEAERLKRENADLHKACLREVAESDKLRAQIAQLINIVQGLVQHL